jgi:hypothetical protein
MNIAVFSTTHLEKIIKYVLGATAPSVTGRCLNVFAAYYKTVPDT